MKFTLNIWKLPRTELGTNIGEGNGKDQREIFERNYKNVIGMFNPSYF